MIPTFIPFSSVSFVQFSADVLPLRLIASPKKLEGENQRVCLALAFFKPECKQRVVDPPLDRSARIPLLKLASGPVRPNPLRRSDGKIHRNPNLQIACWVFNPEILKKRDQY